MLLVDRNFNTVYSNRKNSYKRQLSQMNIPFKKRKIFDCNSTSNSNGYIKNDHTYYSTKNDMNQGVSCSSARMRKGFILLMKSLYLRPQKFNGLRSTLLNKFQIFDADPGMSSLEGYHRSTLRSRDSHGMRRLSGDSLLFFYLIDIFQEVLTFICLSFNQ
jgi:hypothetical protein